MILHGNTFAAELKITEDFKIVSLVPSLTEVFYALNIGHMVVGVTKFCDLPEVKIPDPVMIGGTKNPAIARIIDLKPDIIFASKEENRAEDVELLAESALVIVTDIKTINDNVEFLKSLENLFDLKGLSSEIADEMTISYRNFTSQNLGNALYLIWKSPYMSVGGDTFIHDMMQYAGFSNLLSASTRYPELSESDIEKLDPNYILLSSEPYPFKEADVKELESKFTRSKVILVDGQMFSWYGVRPLYALQYFKKFIEANNL